MESRIIIDEDGTKKWINENYQLHRDDGPAVICPYGSAFWHKNGQRHREDGPAIIWSNGLKKWYRNDKLHREDGPAVIWPDGEKEWWTEGKSYYFQEWADELNLDQKTRIEMVLKWNPE